MNDSSSTLETLIGAAELSSLRLKEVDASSGALPASPPARLSVDIEHSAEVSKEVQSESFVVFAQIKVRVTGSSTAGRRKKAPSSFPALSVRAILQLNYRLPRGAAFSRSDLQKFADVNGIYNAWPYWRELIQNISVRMNLPPLILPLFRIQRSKNPRTGKSVNGPVVQNRSAKAARRNGTKF